MKRNYCNLLNNENDAYFESLYKEFKDMSNKSKNILNECINNINEIENRLNKIENELNIIINDLYLFINNLNIIQNIPDIDIKLYINKENINEYLNERELTEEFINDINDETCCICLENYIIHDTISYLPCNHFFHSSCIKIWINQKRRCPLCNISLISSKKINI